MVDDDALLAGLRVESRRVADISGDDADVQQPVAACPGWGVGRVVAHLGCVHRWATALLQADPPSFFGRGDIESSAPRDASVFDWYREGLGPMFDELQRGCLDDPVATWAGERPRRWWLRRLAHESAVHRFDVEHALTTPSPMDAELAADNIDELFDLFVPSEFDAARFSAGGNDGKTMHLHCTDVDGEWLIGFHEAGVSVDRRHAKGDVAVRGTASDLCLVLWNRQDVARCEVFGDAPLLDEFLDAAAF